MNGTVDAVIKTTTSLLFAFLSLYSIIPAFKSLFWVDSVAFMTYVVKTMLGWVTIVFAVIATASLLLASFLVYPKISTVSSQIWGNRVAFV